MVGSGGIHRDPSSDQLRARRKRDRLRPAIAFLPRAFSFKREVWRVPHLPTRFLNHHFTQGGFLMDIAVLLKMGPISKALCVTSAPLPPRYADAIALHLTLVKALPNINKSEHMRQAGIDEKQLRETSRYQKELRKAFQPINHRKTRYGILKVEDRSFTVDGQHF